MGQPKFRGAIDPVEHIHVEDLIEARWLGLTAQDLLNNRAAQALEPYQGAAQYRHPSTLITIIPTNKTGQDWKIHAYPWQAIHEKRMGELIFPGEEGVVTLKATMTEHGVALEGEFHWVCVSYHDPMPELKPIRWRITDLLNPETAYPFDYPHIAPWTSRLILPEPSVFRATKARRSHVRAMLTEAVKTGDRASTKLYEAHKYIIHAESIALTRNGNTQGSPHRQGVWSEEDQIQTLSEEWVKIERRLCSYNRPRTSIASMIRSTRKAAHRQSAIAQGLSESTLALRDSLRRNGPYTSLQDAWIKTNTEHHKYMQTRVAGTSHLAQSALEALIRHQISSGALTPKWSLNQVAEAFERGTEPTLALDTEMSGTDGFSLHDLIPDITPDATDITYSFIEEFAHRCTTGRYDIAQDKTYAAIIDWATNIELRMPVTGRGLPVTGPHGVRFAALLAPLIPETANITDKTVRFTATKTLLDGIGIDLRTPGYPIHDNYYTFNVAAAGIAQQRKTRMRKAN